MGKNIGVEVVDMEGFVIFNFFVKLFILVVMVRVISDDFYYDFFDFFCVIILFGNLEFLLLAIVMFWKLIVVL